MKKQQQQTKVVKKQVNAVLPEALYKRIRVLAAERGCTGSSIIEAALAQYLSSRAA